MKRFFLNFNFLFLLFVLTFFNSALLFGQERNTRYQKQEGNRSCNLSLQEVQNKTFEMGRDSKQIITYAVTGFKNENDCWEKLKDRARSMTSSSAIAGVYFFTLPPNEIKEIDSRNNDFSQYGKQLIAEYWKDPDSGEELNRYPNVAIPD